MTSILSCFIATLALSADPGMKGLPFGLPPAPDDAVISHVAPPQCLFYLNWAGTASPSASSGSETEKLLAEPEVQEFLNGISKVIVAGLRKTDEDAKPQAPPLPASDATASQPTATPAVPVEAKPAFSISAEDYGDWVNVLLTHPTAIFITDVKVALAKQVEQNVGTKKSADKKAANKKSTDQEPEENESQALASPDVEIQGGMVVALGHDAARLHARLIKYLNKAKKAGAESGFKRIKIAGETWYRSKPATPGDKNRITFGFHGKYFVLGIGEKAIDEILARWNRTTPEWLTEAAQQTPVPRRTGIIYVNLKALRDKLLPLAPSQKDAVAVLELLGFYNVDSLVSTTGLEDYGMINRTLLALDGKPRGLLDMVADRPLTAKDLQPIPRDALLAVAARVDLDRTFNVLTTAVEKAGAGGNADALEMVEELKKEHGVDVHRFLASLGDTWCIYNSPTEGEMAFLGWTAVVPVRDRAALLGNWQKLCAAQNKSEAAKNGDSKPADDDAVEVRTCRFAGHEVYYCAGLPIAPAICFTDHEMVMTLNVPAMKAFLMRKSHVSLATLPGVALALNDPSHPVAVSYCDTPKLFDVVYPLCSLLATSLAAGAHNAKFDLDPTFWPSAPAIRSHLRPDITTVERTPRGLQLTYRYCLPTGGVGGFFWLAELGSCCGSNFDMPFPIQVLPAYSGDPVRRPAAASPEGREQGIPLALINEHVVAAERQAVPAAPTPATPTVPPKK